MKTVSVILLAVVAVLAVVGALFALDRDGFWRRIAGDPDLGDTDFATLGPAPNPNEALVCPAGHCPRRTPDITSPVYDRDAAAMRAILAERLAGRARLARVDDDGDATRLRYVARSRLMRFPDTISVAFVDLGQGRSGVAMHGRAQLGRSDMGVNAARLRAWLRLLADHETDAGGG